MWINSKQVSKCSCSSMEQAVEVIVQPEIDFALVASVDSLEAEEVGTSLDGMLHIQDDVGELLQLDDKISTKLDNQASAAVANNQNSLAMSVVFPSTEQILLPHVSLDGREAASLSSAVEDESFEEARNPVCAQSPSLVIPLKLVSAMKGGREQHGMPPKTKMNVTWASDVYDPPTTLASHTVKNSHNQRSKSRSTKRKDYHKHKHKKGSQSSRGSSGGKKHHMSHSSAGDGDPLHIRSQAPAGRLALDNFSESAEVVEVTDVSVSNGQDSKCGGTSSFLGDSFTKVRYSVAEA